MPVLTPLTFGCLLYSADYHEVNSRDLLAILATEGGKVGAYSNNSNGTRDLGPMQINDKVWIPTLAKEHFSGNVEKTEKQLKDNGCYNVFAASYILSTTLKRADGDRLEAVGLYHSSTPKHKNRYKKKFLENYNRLFKGNNNE